MEWNGFIDEVEKNTFFARLTTEERYGWNEEVWEIYKSSIDKKDLKYIIPGIIFTLTFVDNGKKIKPIFKFYTEKWTKEELDDAKKEAEQIMKELGWNEILI